MMINLLLGILRTFFYILGIFLIYQILIRIVRRVFPFPAPAFIGSFLDSDYRRKLQSPADVIEASGIRSGQRVLEIGCGSGGFITFVARVVGPTGHVEALDIQPGMLIQLERKLALPENQDIQNITIHQASAYDLPFKDGVLDLVYLITVLPEIPDQSRTLAEIKRVLKPGGILAVSELLLDPDYPLIKTTARRGEKAGFQIEGFYGNFWTYTVRFIKP
jgi:ubiquinone/menaquinone biosynthesis C-methylase UbiE